VKIVVNETIFQCENVVICCGGFEDLKMMVGGFRGAKWRVFSYFFLAKKVSKKAFVAGKASVFISKRWRQKQNSSFVVKQLFLIRYLIR
jgi:hypothetical protein